MILPECMGRAPPGLFPTFKFENHENALENSIMYPDR